MSDMSPVLHSPWSTVAVISLMLAAYALACREWHHRALLRRLGRTVGFGFVTTQAIAVGPSHEHTWAYQTGIVGAATFALCLLALVAAATLTGAPGHRAGMTTALSSPGSARTARPGAHRRRTR